MSKNISSRPSAPSKTDWSVAECTVDLSVASDSASCLRCLHFGSIRCILFVGFGLYPFELIFLHLPPRGSGTPCSWFRSCAKNSVSAGWGTVSHPMEKEEREGGVNHRGGFGRDYIYCVHPEHKSCVGAGSSPLPISMHPASRNHLSAMKT